MRRALNLVSPPMSGPDVGLVQRALGLRVDNKYGGSTAAAVMAWKRKVGYPDAEINNGIGVRGQGYLLDHDPLPMDYRDRGQARAIQVLMPVLSLLTRPVGHRTLPTPKMKLRWPIKPFEGPHPIRAPFGEPRGLAGATKGLSGADLVHYLATLSPVSAPGRRIIHHGVDIKAADGTEVFAITSGTARLGGGDNYSRFVRVGDFDYVHLDHVVPDGTRVTAFKTVIGRVFPGQGHVHFSRYVGKDPVNPLRFGGFVNYVDTAAPEIAGLFAVRPNGSKIALDALNGAVAIFVSALDRQSGGNLLGGVHRLGYAILNESAEVVLGPVSVFEMEGIVAEAVGNCLYSVQSTRHTLEPVISYRLTLKSPTGDGWLHTSMFPNGNYTIRVTAGDVMGNETTKSFPIAIAPPT